MDFTEPLDARTAGEQPDTAKLKADALDALSAAIAILDADGRILAVNAAWERFTAREGGDPSRCGAGVNYLHICEGTTGDDARHACAAADAIRAALRGEASPRSLEYPCHSPDALRWFRMRARPLDGAGGGRAVVLHENVTARRLERRARQRGRRRIRTVLESLGEGVVLVDFGGRIRYANPRASEIAGVPLPELLGRDPLDFFPPEIAADLRRARSERLATGVQARYETDYVRPNGERIRLRVYTRPAQDRSGRVVGLVTAILDVTEHRRAQEALERAEAHYRRLVDTSPYGIYQLDREGRFTAVNPAAEALLGRGRPELLGMAYALILARESADSASDLFRRVMDGSSGNEELELQIVRPSGERRTLRITATAIREEGRITGLHGVARDVTEQRALQAQLLHSQKLDAVGRLAGGVAHDFNNILTAIGGNAEMLGTTLRAGDEAWEEVGEILDAVERAGRLTRQLLLFSRKRDARPQTFELSGAITGMLPLLRRLLGEDIRLTTLLSAPGAVSMDPGHLEQVLLNLAVNARDAMPQGGDLRIETVSATLGAPLPVHSGTLDAGDYIVLSVSDTGSGIEPAVLDRIFDPFFTTKGTGGTGLGLSTALGVVENAGGGIEVESMPGEGTHFRVFLPTTPLRDTGPTAAVPAEPPPARLTILLAEDDAAVREVTRQFLQVGENRVLTAATGEEALSLAAQHADPIDLLISDVIMPGMSGRELCERLRTTRPDTPVLYVTGFPGEHLERHGLREDALVLFKPFSRNELFRAIRSALED